MKRSAWTVGFVILCAGIGTNCSSKNGVFADSTANGSGSGTLTGTGSGGGTGAGGGASCNNVSDCPAPKSSCATAACTNGACSGSNLATGTACSDNGGKVCDGSGSCVACNEAKDCAAGVCGKDHTCAMASCSDKVKNGMESDVDCGGPDCMACKNGSACTDGEDCASSYCDPMKMVCADKQTNDAMCKNNAECASNVCFNGKCCGSGDPKTEDFDKDGFTPSMGDCNDCDPNVNPAALDIVNVDMNGKPLPDDQQIDENCDGKPTLPSMPPASCDDDAALVIDATDPVLAAKAIDVCTTDVKEGWGMVSASYLQIDGSPLPKTKAADLGHGIIDKFGPNVAPTQGKKMLYLSNGVARRPGDPDAPMNQSGGDKGYSCAYPNGVPFTSAACKNNPQTGLPHDSIMLRLKLKAPSNAKGVQFNVKFYSAEYPQFVCSQYNDLFLAMMSPAPMGAKPPNTGNITFDSKGEPLSVNNAFFDVCTNCAAGTAQLMGTGFDNPVAGGTQWLMTTAPVGAGSTFTIDFAVMDAGDGVQASAVLLDNLGWDAKSGILKTM